VPPFDIDGTAEFTITPRDGATVVICMLRGQYSPLDKLKAVVARTDSVLGHEIDLGLANLKVAVEG
jgi:hypothetical protein